MNTDNANHVLSLEALVESHEQRDGARKLALEDYPAAILDAEKKLLALSDVLYQKQSDLATLDLENEVAICTDESLKNENTRKAARQSMQQGKTYIHTLALVRNAERDKKEAAVHVAYLRDCFSVEKLCLRLEIAQLEQEKE